MVATQISDVLIIVQIGEHAQRWGIGGSSPGDGIQCRGVNLSYENRDFICISDFDKVLK